MIEELAYVVATHDDWVELEARPRAACGGCAASDSCGTAALARWFGRHPLRMRVRNDLGVQVGDQVVLGLTERALLQAAARLYLVPVLSLIGGALLGQWLGAGAGLADAGAGLGALSGVALALYAAHRARLAPADAPLLLRRCESGSSPSHLRS